MGKVSMGIILLGFLMAPAAASLMPATFGFPVIVHSGQAVSFSNDLASSTDFESMNLDFNLMDGLMSPSGTPEMPMAGMGGWPMQGMATPDLSHMAKLFDFPAFKLH